MLVAFFIRQLANRQARSWSALDFSGEFQCTSFHRESVRFAFLRDSKFNYSTVQNIPWLLANYPPYLSPDVS